MNRISFNKVKFRNFLSYGSKWQEIELLRGVNLVTGIDKDTGKSNGSGKSSLLESISFALFGSVHNDVKQSEIINWKNKKGTEVELYFTKGKTSYKIYRSLKPNHLEIYKDNELIDPPSHVKYYQEQLESIIGINKRTFSKLIHSNINSANQILSMSKGEKRKFMETMFGLGIYTELQKLSNEKLKNIQDKLRENELKHSHNERSIEDMKSTIDNLKSKISIKSDYDEELKRLETLIKESKSGLMQSWELKKLKEEHDKNVEEKESKEKELDRLWTQTDMLEKSLTNKEKMVKSIKLQKVPDSKIIEKKENDIQEILDKETQVINKINTDIAVVTSNIIRIVKQMDGIDGKDVCPTCGQEIDEGIHTHNQDEKKELDKSLSILYNKHKESEDKLKENQSKLDKIQQIKKKCEQLNRDKEKKDELTKEISTIEKDLYKLSEDRIPLAKRRTYLDVCILSSGSKLDIQKKEEDEYQTVLQEKEHIKEKKELEDKAKAELKLLIKDTTSTIDKATKENSDILKSDEKLNDLKDHISYIKEICKDEKAKSLAISKSRPALVKGTNEYLSNIGFNFYITLDNWLNAVIKGPGITNGDYKSLSSGEKKTVDLALQNAFLDIARIQAGVLPDILIYDEVLDSSIDGSGLSKIMEIIRKKEVEDGLKIFIISHNDNITETDEPDNVYKVTKKNGFSNVEIK